MMLLFKRIRLWRIERALDIKLTKWQKDFVLHKSDFLMPGRRSGKSVACVVEVLLWRKDPIVIRFGKYNNPMRDPDYLKNVRWHDGFLFNCNRKCAEKGIKVFSYIRPDGTKI